MENLDKIRKFAEVLKSAASDGKVTFVEALQIAVSLFKAQSDFREIARILKTTEPEILAKEFGQSSEFLGRLMLNLNGLFAHATNLVALFSELKNDAKTKTGRTDKKEKTGQIAETTASAGDTASENQKNT